MNVIKNNLELAQYLEKLPEMARQKAYQELLPDLDFKVKSFGFLMVRYEKWKKDHGNFDTEN
jgi:hypothetical protein